jgi:tetratricopeptide (TPR) repeat protein
MFGFNTVQNGIVRRVIADPLKRSSLFASGNDKWELFNFRGAYDAYREYQESEILGVYFFLKGKDILADDNLPLAAGYFDKSFHSASNISWLVNNIGLAYYRRNDFVNAERKYLELLKVYPEYAVGWYNLGLLYKNSSREDLALNSFRKAAEINPADTDSLKEQADILFDSGHRDEAEGIFTRYFGGSIAVAEEYFLKGSNEHKDGKIQNAIREWEKAVVLAPNLQKAYYNIGVASLEIHDREKAMKAFNSLIKADPASQLSAKVRAFLETENHDQN